NLHMARRQNYITASRCWLLTIRVREIPLQGRSPKRCSMPYSIAPVKSSPIVEQTDSELYAVYVENTNQPYLFSEVKEALDAGSDLTTDGEAELTPRVVLFHGTLLFFTAITTTITGVLWTTSSKIVTDDSFFGELVAPLLSAVAEIKAGNMEPLVNGLLFTFT